MFCYKNSGCKLIHNISAYYHGVCAANMPLQRNQLLKLTLY